MKILVLSPQIPWPLYGGNVVRVYGILKELSRHGHEIVLLAGSEGPPLADDHPLRVLCREVVQYPRPESAKQSHPIRAALSSAFTSLPYTAAKFGGAVVTQNIRALLEREPFDLIFANFAFMAHAVPEEFARRTPMVLDEHESEGLLWRQYLRQGSLPKRAFALLNLAKLSAFQKAVCGRIVAMLCASDRETEFARTFVPQRVQLLTVPNGVDTEYFAPSPEAERDPNSIVLCGGYSVYRNVEAALWFARSIFPVIKTAVPAAQFWIVGSSPPDEIQRLADDPAIHVTGTVPDVRPYYARAAVTIAPYRYGEGTKLKVLEAMASGAPVVSTPIGSQGIEVRDAEHVMIVNSAQEFAAKIIYLLTHEEVRRKLAERARAVIEREYSWKKIVDDLNPGLCALVNDSRTSATFAGQ